MERFGPLPEEPATKCERKAREADVVVCIVAHRYGFVPDRGRGSITRREVEAAKAPAGMCWSGSWRTTTREFRLRHVHHVG